MGQRRRIARTRRGPLVALCASLVVLVVAACGGGETVSGTPGYDDRSREVDRAPFEMANPTTTAGPTTIPGAGPTTSAPAPVAGGTPEGEGPTAQPGGERSDAGERPGRNSGRASTVGGNAPTGELPQPVTTTTEVTAPFAPPTDAITSLCGMIASVSSFRTLSTNPLVDVPAAVETLRRNTDRYLAVAPQEMVQIVTYVRDAVRGITQRIIDADYVMAEPAVQAAINESAAGTGEWPQMRVATDRIWAYELEHC